MPKYKIIYDRQNCIGVSSCAILADKFWKMNEDTKADLIGALKKNGFFELEIEEKDVHINKEAARNCPVGVIKIFDAQGKQIMP